VVVQSWLPERVASLSVLGVDAVPGRYPHRPVAVAVTIASTEGLIPDQAEGRLAEFTELLGTAIANT
jgi:hypothetical protein